MSQDEFTKLFKYMQTEFKATRSEIAEVDKKINGIQVTFDSFANQLLSQNQEHLMLVHKVDRMEQWLQKIASKTGVHLEY